MDKLDKHILSVLQKDATQTTAEIAEQVGLSTTPCWKRIQRLQEIGIIKSKVTLLDPDKLNLKLTVFVHIKTARHEPTWLKQFASHTAAFEEVIEIYRLSGEYDYMLKVMVADMQGYDNFYKRFIAGVPLTDVTSSFAMEKIKNETSLPLSNV
ncbi:Lrp/AsnC family transcriptional regulator [Alteromonas sp. ASW11-36]|uniref:Lrp/AsnC family transcriptional regulator n=1 Tax=Alteromonas arenosi TaxID=3055817 RepID=A0ABT7SXX2_9ALTE|nr:Lrp/AsnC family transcriptional regulator [Alteromonas sp. ASW11-36]MDM7860854.1 Lrp/AsnC family transcriptional regulator [Alteromonas sp. ASW11-36]